MVFDLIHSESNSWNEQAIRNIFSHEEADQILCMHLPRHPQTDMYIWRADKSGQYSVRSGYRLLCGEELYPTGEPNLLQSVSANIYNTLWSLKLPAKVKITGWRFFNNFLPTAVNLHNRRLNVQLNCCLCDSASESVSHLLLECPFSAQVLSAFHIALPVVLDEQQWLQWLSHLFVNLSKEKIKYLIVSLWAIWTPADLVFFIQNYILEYDAITTSHAPEQSQVTRACWIPPPVDFVKVNFDVGYNNFNKTSVAGIIIRNSDGLILAASTCPSSHVPSPEVAEAHACDQAVSLTRDLGFQKAIFEGDALNIIKKVLDPSIDMSETFGLIHNIKRLKLGFEAISFSHVFRSQNVPAHVLAKEGWCFAYQRVWIEEAPDSVVAAANKDCWWVDPPL
ncbi:hypothetical protein V6N12_016296 [Hibiscus sabdariffa]|uniref:Reverse transcriptase zinc-binding domain n=1 Tax=Hibiscus sabdariffa TaxID=183260 RepID=A0ABR2CD59_9ROSI